MQRKKAIYSLLIALGVAAPLVVALRWQGCSDCPTTVPFMNADKEDDRLPQVCMDASESMAPCVDALVGQYYSPSPVGQEQAAGEHRGEALVRSFAGPLSLLIDARAGEQKVGFDGAVKLASEWQAELNQSYNHPRPQSISRMRLSILRGEMITQPMRSPMHLRADHFVYAFWYGEGASKRQIMSCFGGLAFGGMQVGIADKADAMDSLSDRDRDLAKACLYYMLGAPIPAWLQDDVHLHRAVRVATTFRSCVQALLPGDTYRVQKVTEDPAALRIVADCMRADLAER